MKYYGIKTPGNTGCDSYIWWITNSEYSSWVNFFSHSDREGNYNARRNPTEEAIRAYKKIGYSCVELKLTEITQ